MPTHSLRLRLFYLMTTLLLASACGGSGHVAVSSASADVNTFLQDALETVSTLTYDDLIAQLGAPVRVKAEPMAGSERAAAPSDTLRTLIYYGLELGLHESTASARVIHFALTDARYTSPEGLRVGYAESQVLSTLGRPTRRDPAQLIYQKENPSHCVLVVFLEQDAVSRMEWRFTDE